MIRISVITVNLNNANGLLKTIQSVINQTYKNWEFIIIDGGSTDKSQSVIEEHMKNLSYWVSEPDNGIYDAMNKGIAHASGEYLLFLNSGDYLYNNNVIENALSKSTCDIVYGNQLIELKGKIINTWKPGRYTWFNMYNATLPHSCTLIRKTLFDEIGCYNTRYSIAADYEFFLRAFSLVKYSFQYIDIDFSVFNKEGVSSDSDNLPGILQERRHIIETYIPANLLPDFDSLKRFIHTEREYGKYGFIWLMNNKTLRNINRFIYRALKKFNIIIPHRTFNG